MDKETLYLSIINNLTDGVYYVDADRRIQFWNKAAEELTGYSAQEVVGLTCQETQLNHIDEDGRPLCTIGCPLYATIIDGQQRKARVFLRHKEGYRIPVRVNMFPFYEEGETVGAVEVFHRASPMVYEDKLVEKLTGIAMHDALTGLPNRRYTESFLQYKMDEFQRFQRPVAVIFADIDDFRKFNNECGHEAGDVVLKNVAATLMHNMRKQDLVGRWGGEEILGIYTINQEYDAPILAEKFRQMVINTQVEHDGKTLSVTISVGVTVARVGDTVDSVIQRADKLMYESKRKGKNRITSG